MKLCIFYIQYDISDIMFSSFNNLENMRSFKYIWIVIFLN